MPNTLPDEGEWLLSAAAGQPLPPFVKLSAFFDANCGFVEGMNATNFGSLTKITAIAPDRFGAFFALNGVKGQFEATIDDNGDLTLDFLAPQKCRATARALSQEREVSGRSANVARALTRIAQFGAQTARGAFPNISRSEVARGLVSRVQQPERIDQSQSYTCGPAAFMFNFAKADPDGYARYVTDLYERGDATIGALHVQPSQSFRFDRKYELVSSAADWIALGSLRDSENWFFQYHTGELPFVNAAAPRNTTSTWLTWEGVRGGTSPGEIRKWFTAFGYTDVVDRSTAFRADLNNLREADRRYRNGERVCLSICANILYCETRAEAAKGGSCDHFVVLASPIEFIPGVKFKLYTWGGYRQLKFNLTPEEFLNSYYGFVAARR